MAFETIGVRAVIEGLAAFERASRVIKKELVDIIDKEKELERQNERVRKGLRNIGLAMVAAAGASAAFLFSATRLAARVETLGIVTAQLGKNIGLTEKEVRALEQGIVKQGITLRAARGSMALMVQANIDLAKGTELARLAQDAAVIANLNSSEAFERLIFVISSGNVRMARTLGLQVSFQQAYKDTAKAVGKAVTELTQQEKIVARTNVIIGAGARITGTYAAAMETAGKKVLSLDRHVEESRRIFGEAFLPVFAAVVDKVTEGLVAFQNLDTATQRQISTGLAMGTVWTGLIGGAALFVSALGKIRGAIQTLGFAMKTSLGPIGLFLGLLAAITTAVVAQRAKLKELRREFDEQADVVLETANTYEEYEKGIREAAKETGQFVITQEKWNSLTKKARDQLSAYKDVIILTSKAQFDASKRAELMAQRNLELADAIEKATEETEDLTVSQEELEAQEKALEEQQERLQDSLSRLKDLMKEDITEGFIEWKEDTEELTAAIEILESKKYLTNKQKEELRETREKLEETTKAWRDHTANVIFSLAEQALAIDGLTEEEILALAKLQVSLGLVDEGYEILTAAVLEAGGQMDATGDQSTDWVRDLLGIQTALSDATTDAEDLGRSLRGLPSLIEIAVIINQIGTVGPIGGGGVQVGAGGGGGGGGTPIPTAPSPTPTGGGGGSQEFGFAIAASSQAARFANSINTLVTAIKAAPLLAMPAPAIAGSTQNNSFNMNIHTSAPREPIISDFRTLEALSNAL